MIKINIKKNQIIIEGHSNFSEYGTDIVCASVSSISITTINALIRLDKDSVSYEEKDGYIKLNILKHNNYVDILIENMIDLLKELEKQYKKNIKVNEEV